MGHGGVPIQLQRMTSLRRRAQAFVPAASYQLRRILYVHDSRHLQADCQEPGSAPEPYARQSSMGYLDLFMSDVGPL